MSRPLSQRQLSDCIFWNNLSVQGFRTPSSFTSISVICPVLEYAVPVWHHLTKTQTDSIESVQNRALHIIYSFSKDIPYCNSLDVADIASLSTRRNELSRKVFHSTAQPSSLHSLLLEIQIYLLVFEPPPNSHAYPHKLKISVVRIIRPFTLSNIDSIFTSITRLYTPSFQLYVYMLLLNRFTFPCFNCFSLWKTGYNMQ